MQRQLDARQATQGQPGASGKPGGSQQPGGQGGSGAPQPGASSSPDTGQQGGQPSDQKPDPANDRTNPGSTPADLRGALSDFRTGLTVDDALRVLDALAGQQRGIEQLIEGPRNPNGPNPEY